MSKGVLIKSLSLIFVGMVIFFASFLLRGDVPVRYDSAAPVLTQGFLIVGLILIILGIIRLIFLVRKQV
jgi:hypothetical protein